MKTPVRSFKLKWLKKTKKTCMIKIGLLDLLPWEKLKTPFKNRKTNKQVLITTSYKTRFNRPFSKSEIAGTKSGKEPLLFINLMCLGLLFYHLLRNLPFWAFLGVWYFRYFTFYIDKATRSLHNLDTIL